MNSTHHDRAVPSPRVTPLERLLQLQPALQDMLKDAATVRDLVNAEHAQRKPASYCQHRIWLHGYAQYPSFKQRLRALHLGGYSADEWPTEFDAYRVALNALLEILPPCRRCLCAAG